jgi:phage-related protein
MATIFPVTLPAPSYSTSKSTKPRVLKAGFGDGYAQRASDGLNSLGKSWRAVWQVLSVSEADTLEAFLEARGGWDAILWTPPDESTQIKVICSEWTRTSKDPGIVEMSLTMEKVFDL